MIPWYYLLVALSVGLELGRMIVYREWRKEREAEFDRAMDEARKGRRG